MALSSTAPLSAPTRHPPIPCAGQMGSGVCLVCTWCVPEWLPSQPIARRTANWETHVVPDLPWGRTAWCTAPGSLLSSGSLVRSQYGSCGSPSTLTVRPVPFTGQVCTVGVYRIASTGTAVGHRDHRGPLVPLLGGVVRRPPERLARLLLDADRVAVKDAPRAVACNGHGLVGWRPGVHEGSSRQSAACCGRRSRRSYGRSGSRPCRTPCPSRAKRRQSRVAANGYPLRYGRPRCSRTQAAASAVPVSFSDWLANLPAHRTEKPATS
jgi:hypothetical protein